MRALALYFLSACAAIAADTIPTIVWTVDCQAPSAWNMQLTSGESIDMQPQYLLRQRVLTLTNATSVSFQFRAAGTTNVPYELPGSVLNATNGKARIVWPSSNVVEAGAYEYKILVAGSESANMRAFGTITVDPGFGAVTGSPPPYVALVTASDVSDVRSIATQALAIAQAAGTGVSTGAWRNAQWFSLSWEENPTNAPDVVYYRTNLDQVIQRQGYNRTRHDRVAQVTEQHSFFPLAFSASPEAVASISSNGYLTHHSDGVVTAVVAGTSFARTNALIMRTDGFAVDRYWAGSTGSIRAAAIQAVDASVTGATMEIWSSFDPTNGVFVRSTNLWLKPAPECAAAWNSRSAELGGGLLITPRHAIVAQHAPFRARPGDTLTWVTSSNVAHTAIVLAENNVAADISLIRLDRDVPVRRCKFISDPAAYLPTGVREIPLACGDVHGVPRMQLVIGGSAGWGVRGYTGISWWKSPEKSAWRDLFYHYPVCGDSSQPVLLTVGNELVPLFTLYFPGSGPCLHTYLPEIRAGIAAWGDTNDVEFLDVSTYTEF